MERVGRTELLKLAGVLASVAFVLVGLPFLERNGYITGSAMLAILGVFSVGAGMWQIRSPEEHDVRLANDESLSESRARWRRLGERLAGVGAVLTGLVFVYIGLA